jgi:O-acetyl-ADP-ribose deacetylase (regulator of RNase III)
MSGPGFGSWQEKAKIGLFNNILISIPIFCSDSMKIGKERNAELVIFGGDITQSGMDAIVNAANAGLLGGGGVDGAIHRAAGSSALYDAAQKAKAARGWDSVPTGESVITPGFDLERYGTRYVIHTVGPIQGVHKDKTLGLLENCLKTSLGLAEKQGDISSVAYPLISTGAYGVPVETFSQAANNVFPAYGFKRVRKVAIYVFLGPRTTGNAMETLKNTLGM